jgi:hypothetical protein
MLTKQERKQQYRAIEKVRLLRVKNLRALQDFYGSTAELSRRIGKAPSFVTSLCGPNPRRDVGEVLARDIEQLLHLSSGWLDQEHS